MDSTRSERAQPLEMGAGRIAFVYLEAIARVGHGELGHEVVTKYFGDDARCGDRLALRIAVDDATLRHVDAGHGAGVDEQVLGHDRQGAYGSAHGEE